MLNSRKSWRLVVGCVAGLFACIGGGRVQAQWGGYGGFGFGFGLGPQTPASVNFLNDHAIARTHAAASARPQPLRAPIPVSRDVDFFTRYDAATRAEMTNRVARRRVAVPNAAAPAQPVTFADNSQPSRPAQSLASFFNKMRQLIWPADAPTEGDLAAKRSVSDAKTLELLFGWPRPSPAWRPAPQDARAVGARFRPALSDTGRRWRRSTRAGSLSWRHPVPELDSARPLPLPTWPLSQRAFGTWCEQSSAINSKGE